MTDNQFFLKLRERRLALGISQVSLAQNARVSLPTIQNLEAGKANLSWELLQRVLLALGMVWNFDEAEINWNLLAFQGLPITLKADKREQRKNKVQFIKDEFEMELRKAVIGLIQQPNAEAREWDALVAYLWALRDHFPSIYRRICGHLDIAPYLTPSKVGRLIKLRRLALSQMEAF
jgi:transcriptional regulator with XRE-family HTH domain